jgi:flagellar biogenesis protein FliO
MMVAGDESPLIQAHEEKDHFGLRMLIFCSVTMLIVVAALAFGFLGLRRLRAKSAA